MIERADPRSRAPSSKETDKGHRGMGGVIKRLDIPVQLRQVDGLQVKATTVGPHQFSNAIPRIVEKCRVLLLKLTGTTFRNYFDRFS